DYYCYSTYDSGNHWVF
nr:immunoglobulin light chain junction region [Macaca mulatta]MOX41670.1 immunoglobulin light chain junction region [Macaca mulatta]MOX41712.1 immunoglobulin light chain junction region [Macaca mulatta]MOX41870.1 immunoglobulin light chain junction region [Macaca mulatta]MOX41990.1 immunoglobulin light chain junction region [Macaca mulatta]